MALLTNLLYHGNEFY